MSKNNSSSIFVYACDCIQADESISGSNDIAAMFAIAVDKQADSKHLKSMMMMMMMINQEDQPPYTLWDEIYPLLLIDGWPYRLLNNNLGA